MNFKDLIISLSLLLISGIVSAQSYKYYVPYYADGKYGYSDTLGNMVIQPRFGYADRFEHDSIAYVYNSTEGKTYNERPGLLKGIINSKGKDVVPCKYSHLYISETYIYTWDPQNKKGLYTVSGLTVLKDLYEEIMIRGHWAAGIDFAGYITVVKYDSKKRAYAPVLKSKGDNVVFDYDNTAKPGIIIYDKGLEKIYDTLGRFQAKQITRDGGSYEAADMTEDMVSETEDYNRPVRIYAENGLYGLVSTSSGRSDSFPAVYNSLRYFSAVDQYLYFAEKDGRWGMINGRNEIIIPLEYDSVKNAFHREDMSRGYLFEVKQNGFWGVINTADPGKPLIPCRYNSTEMMFPHVGNCYKLRLDKLEGFALVQKGIVTGYIEPKYAKVLVAGNLSNTYFIAEVQDLQGHKFWVNRKGFEYKKPD